MRTGKGYIRKLEFVFHNEKAIREAVLDARNHHEKAGKNGSGIGDPTASQAIRNITPLRSVRIRDENLEWPEDWLRVVDATYAWCDMDRLVVAKDRYAGVDYKRTCAKLNISGPTYFNLLRDIRTHAAFCAANLQLIRFL